MKNSVEHLLWLFTVIFVCCFLKILHNIIWHVFSSCLMPQSCQASSKIHPYTFCMKFYAWTEIFFFFMMLMQNACMHNCYT